MTLHTIYNRNDLSAFEALVTKDVKSQISELEKNIKSTTKLSIKQIYFTFN